MPAEETASHTGSSAAEDLGLRPWRELPFWALVVLVLVVYFARLGDRPVRHEEPHRGQVALEMIDGGDWIVPREQGIAYLSRPPLQNWSIAVCALLRGGMDQVAIRLIVTEYTVQETTRAVVHVGRALR